MPVPHTGSEVESVKRNHYGTNEGLRLAALAVLSCGLGYARAESLTLSEAGLTRPASGELLLSGGWGDALGEFGKRDEASRPGPMDFALVDQTLYVLDPVNARVQVFDLRTGDASVVPIETKTADFLAVDGAGRVAVLDAFVQRELRVFAATGSLERRADLPDAIQLASSVRLDRDCIWIEDRHDRMFAIELDNDNGVGPARPVRSAPGRLLPDGRSLSARKAPDGAIALRIATGEQTDVEHTVLCDGAVRSVVALESDAQGCIYLAMRREAADSPEHPADIVLAKLSADGMLLGSLVLPDAYVTDHYRKLLVTPAGDVIQMQTTEEGVRFVRWTMDATGTERSLP